MAMSKRHTSGICIATSCHSSQVAWTVHPHSQSSEAPTSRHFHKSPASKADTVVTPWCSGSLVHAPASFPGMPEPSAGSERRAMLYLDTWQGRTRDVRHSVHGFRPEANSCFTRAGDGGGGGRALTQARPCRPVFDRRGAAVRPDVESKAVEHPVNSF